jgi:hypothetical protein
VKHLYGDETFLKSLYNSLTSSGILVAQVGEAVDEDEVAETYPENLHWQRHVFVEGLISRGFSTIVDYALEHAEFTDWQFYVSFKNDVTLSRWWMNSAQFNLEIRKRSVRVVPGKEDFLTTLDDLPFVYFDGNQMQKYQLTRKQSQLVFCRREPVPDGCEPQLFDPSVTNYGAEHFYVADDGGGSLSLYANMSIPAGSYMYLESAVRTILVSSCSRALIKRLTSYNNGETVQRGIGAVGALMEKFGCPARNFADFNCLRIATGLQVFASQKCPKTRHRAVSPYDPSFIRKVHDGETVTDRTIKLGDRI